jgi:hypothetical protein
VHEYTHSGTVSIKLKEPQRVFIVQCGFAVLAAAVAIGFFRTLVG